MAEAGAVEIAHEVFDSGRFQDDLARLVACPTESQDPRGEPHLAAYLADEIGPMLAELGCAAEIHANPEEGGPPFLTATRHEGAELPTVLIYGHGDVVRGQEAQWREGLAPFRLTQEGTRWYGRGIADNKVQHLINLHALGSVLKARGALGFNVTWLMEMGEEIGSPGLKTFCATHRDRLAADLLIASDGPRLKPDTPTIFTGARGGATFDLVLRLREGAHHSGNFGGLIADPAMVLAHALASITDRRGQIRLPEWRPTSLTPEVRAVLARLPLPESGVPLDPDWGEADLSPVERVLGWNSFAVLAMTSGLPDAPVNAIAGEARATCQLRFVVGTDQAGILPALRRHLDREGFDAVEIVENRGPAFAATRVDAGHPYVGFVADVLTEATGKATHLLPNLGGSLPNDCFADVLGLPTIWIPHSYAGCAQHAPNEHVLTPICREGLGMMAALFDAIGQRGLPPKA